MVVPSTAVSGSRDQSVGRVAGVDGVAGFGPLPRASSVGRLGQLLQRRLHLVVWLGSMPSVLTAVRRELTTACDYFRRLQTRDISSYPSGLWT